MKFLKASNRLLLMSRGFNNLVKSSVYRNIEVPNILLSDLILKDTSKYANKPAITCGLTGRTLNHKEIKELTDKVHYSLIKKVGLEVGDVVGLVVANKPEFPAAIYGALKGGLKVTFINPIFTPEEIRRQFVNAGVKCIIAMQDNKKSMEQVVPSLVNYRGTIYLDDADGWEFEGKPFLDGMVADLETPYIDIHGPAILPYSSGTTGVPKGVMLSHHNCVSNLIQTANADMSLIFPTTDDYQDRILSPIPFYHIYGFNCIMNFYIREGGHIITMPKFEPTQYIDCLKKYKPTQLYTVPSLLLFLASHPDVNSEDLASVKKVTTGAAPATRSLIEKFRAKVQRDDLHIGQGYGLSETSPVVLVTPKDMPDSKVGSTGQLLPSTDARIVCLTTGKDLPANQSGELCIKGPQVMKGYLNNEEATKAMIDENGWMRTGDVAYYDDDGYFYIVDRCKELIKCKGNQVSPTELEGIIMELDNVADVAIIGIPDERCGEVPKAFVVLKANRKLSEDEINDFINPRIAPYKRLVGGIRFIDLIPRNHTGKIIRRELKSLQ